MQIHSSSQNQPPPVTRVTFLYLETLETLFDKNFLNKKCLFNVGQHFGNIFLLWQQIATKNNKCEKIGVCCFWSQQQNFLQIFSLLSCWRAPDIFCACARANPSKFCLEILGVCSFELISSKFQICMQQSIFVVQKRQLYEKTSIFNNKFDEIKIK